ncbi:hypothetical protein PFISCL1PPCAC_15573 [Pristionchus fissidentatus]|uniref:Uncharacterized protein n=1 Tax=Pristionchus fissidentatus TaxID=1538716 RepID=A0AAV5W0I3_9BILA|nr:hypothetical protein PFISCL1PPCAC_15573 [Pristionchus fissidentatus]
MLGRFREGKRLWRSFTRLRPSSAPPLVARELCSKGNPVARTQTAPQQRFESDFASCRGPIDKLREGSPSNLQAASQRSTAGRESSTTFREMIRHTRLPMVYRCQAFLSRTSQSMEGSL